MTTTELEARITAYLSGGGLFNPELADHTAVRDLLIDCRVAITALHDAQQQEKSGFRRLTGSEVIYD